jgi:tetratricopeptide (TPR) repeat protein
MRSRWTRPLCLAFALGVSQAATRPCAAQDAVELQQARDKFQKALALQTGGDWAGALALLKEVAAVRATPQVRFNIALCEENLGQLVAAVGDYELAAADAREADENDVVKEAESRLEELRGRIPKIVVERGENADSATITLDGVTLGDRVMGQPMNVDPGPHVVTARAAGFESFRATVRVAEAETKTIAVALSKEPTPFEPTSPPPPATQPPSGGSRTAAYVVGGLGLVSLGAAGVMYGLRQNTIDDLDEQCQNGVCPERLRDTRDRGQTYTTLGNIGLGVGAVGLGVGVILLLTSNDPSESGFMPSAPDSVAGMSYRGRF